MDARTMNEIVVINTTELKNRGLAKNVQRMYNNNGKIDRTLWDTVKAISEIVEKEQYKDDFKNITEFAKAIGFGKSYIYAAVKAISIHEMDAFVTMSVGVASELIRAIDDAHTLDMFVEYVASVLGVATPEEAAENINGMTQKVMREFVANYRKTWEATEAEATEAEATEAEATEAEATEAEATEAEAEAEAKVLVTNEYVRFNYTLYKATDTFIKEFAELLKKSNLELVK